MEAKPEQDNTIYLSSRVNEIFATTKVTQYFTNESDKSMELSVLIPIIKKLTLSKFIVSIEDKIIISKVIPKEKAEEKYNDAIASGNVGFMSKYEDNKSYSVNIGNLAPKRRIKLQTIFIEMLGSDDLSYEFNIIDNYPAFYDEKLKDINNKNKKIEANIKIETQSKITRLIPKYLNEEAEKNSKYNVKFSPDYKNAEIEYNNDKPNLIFDKDKENKTFRILFRTESMNKPLLYCQYNPELKETSYSINYTYISKYLKEIPIPELPDEDTTISYVNKYEENVVNETPGLFIFLIDQSGSMSGNPILLVRKALLLFIQSLPANSYFQLIGFGSNFKKYNEEPVLYNKENVDNIIKTIKELTANLGGTNISKPLEEIFRNECYSKINLSRNIFLLTDGEVFDREQCINLISNNSKKFRVHAMGLGNSFDEILIKQCGELGKGTSSFIKNEEKINSAVINTLNNGLRPYLTDIKFDFENYKEEIASNIISCNPINNFSYQNEIMNYSFILPGDIELTNLKIKISGKDPINQFESITCFDNIMKLENGEEMSKMIVGKALKNNDELLKDEKNEVKFAKKYQILSKNTALFAEILNEEKQQSELIKVNLSNVNAKKSRNEYNVDRFKNIYQNNPSFGGIPMSGCFGLGGMPMYGMGGMQNGGLGGMSMPQMAAMPMPQMVGMSMPAMGGMGGMPMGGMGGMPMGGMGGMPMSGMGMQIGGMPMPAMGGNNNSLNNMGMMNSMQNMMMINMNNMNLNMMNNMNACCANFSMNSNPQNLNNMSSSSKPSSSSSSNINTNNKKKNRVPTDSKKAKNKGNKSSDAQINLIMSQDIIEGFWNENDETKAIINIITSEKFDKIKNKVNALNKGEISIKIIYTILVIYYLKKECTDNLDEYKLVLNKAIKFLEKNGINYDDFVSNI